MEQTTNFNLQKPGYADGADIEVINQNMDAIDAALAAQAAGLEDKAAASTLASHTENGGIHVNAEKQTIWNNKATTVNHTATLTTAGWSASAPYTQTVTVTGLLASDTPIADVVLSGTAATAKLQLEAWGCVGRIVAAANSITAYCYEEKPTTAIPLQIKVVR